MYFNGKEILFPSIPKVSFFKVIEDLEKMSEDKDSTTANYAKSILKDVEPFPILKEGFEDTKLLVKYKKPIDKLSRTLFPDVLSTNEIKALIPPFEFIPFYASKRFQKILQTSEQNFSYYLKDVDGDQFYLQACFAILTSYFGYSVQINKPMMIQIDNNGKKELRTYRIAMNADMVEYVPTDKAIDITKEDFEELLNSQENIALWKEKFPPNSWIMRGVLMINMMDVTIDQSISNITSNLLIKSADSFENIRNGLRSLFGNSSIEVGMITFNQNELAPVYKDDVHSIILKKNMSLDCKQHMSSSTFKQLMVNKQALVISDVDDFVKKNTNQFAVILEKLKWKSYIMAPLIHEGELLGFMELASDKAYELNSVSHIKLDQIIPVLALATKRFITEDQNHIEAVIQQECTTVHDSVKWRFEEEARQFLISKDSGGNPVFKDIIFRDIYPLYGQLDIKNSSSRRNEAVKKDLLKQLNGVGKILTTALELTKMPAYEELLFRLEVFKKDIKNEISAGSEHKIVEFFKSEVYPVFKHLKLVDVELGKLVDKYNTKLDPELNTIYDERQKYDHSVNLINQKLASFLDDQQVEAQKMFPHYFERYKTDGVEFNMYIGQSIANNKQFDPIHLQNLRLWQLRVMVEMENEFAILQKELNTSIEIASLILVYNSSLAVHFRMDEKRFDVEGAYNARYEIIKKRIDKAHIKGTRERITLPGKIAIIYSQDQDAMEYRKYANYLVNKGLIKSKIEDYEIENLQGISGLRALRIEVNYSKPKTDKGITVEELIKSIEE
jgi:hypothetical protein